MVTRETSLAEGLASVGIDPSRSAIDRLLGLAELLESEGVSHGHLGPNEGSRILTRHILESAALSPSLPEGPVLDVGSGAGLPGLVLGCIGHQVTLLDSQQRRVRFIESLIARLGLSRVSTEQGRAEDLARTGLRESYDAVVCRALATPAVALELCIPFVRPGGEFLMLASPANADETQSDQEEGLQSGSPAVPGQIVQVARLLGGASPGYMPLAVPGVDLPRWVMMVRKIHPTPERFPRRAGLPRSRPLG